MTTLAQRKARKRYYENNKEACNESSRKRYLKLKAENPEKLAEINKRSKEKILVKSLRSTTKILKMILKGYQQSF